MGNRTVEWTLWGLDSVLVGAHLFLVGSLSLVLVRVGMAGQSCRAFRVVVLVVLLLR